MGLEGTFLESKQSVVHLYCLFIFFGLHADLMEAVERSVYYDVD